MLVPDLPLKGQAVSTLVSVGCELPCNKRDYSIGEITQKDLRPHGQDPAESSSAAIPTKTLGFLDPPSQPSH